MSNHNHLRMQASGRATTRLGQAHATRTRQTWEDHQPCIREILVYLAAIAVEYQHWTEHDTLTPTLCISQALTHAARGHQDATPESTRKMFSYAWPTFRRLYREDKWTRKTYPDVVRAYAWTLILWLDHVAAATEFDRASLIYATPLPEIDEQLALWNEHWQIQPPPGIHALLDKKNRVKLTHVQGLARQFIATGPGLQSPQKERLARTVLRGLHKIVRLPDVNAITFDLKEIIRGREMSIPEQIAIRGYNPRNPPRRPHPLHTEIILPDFVMECHQEEPRDTLDDEMERIHGEQTTEQRYNQLEEEMRRIHEDPMDPIPHLHPPEATMPQQEARLALMEENSQPHSPEATTPWQEARLASIEENLHLNPPDATMPQQEAWLAPVEEYPQFPLWDSAAMPQQDARLAHSNSPAPADDFKHTIWRHRPTSLWLKEAFQHMAVVIPATRGARAEALEDLPDYIWHFGQMAENPRAITPQMVLRIHTQVFHTMMELMKEKCLSADHRVLLRTTYAMLVIQAVDIALSAGTAEAIRRTYGKPNVIISKGNIHNIAPTPPYMSELADQPQLCILFSQRKRRAYELSELPRMKNPARETRIASLFRKISDRAMVPKHAAVTQTLRASTEKPYARLPQFRVVNALHAKHGTWYKGIFHEEEQTIQLDKQTDTNEKIH